MNVAELREERERLSLQAENAALELEINSLRSASRSETVQEASRILADRSAFLYDHPNFGFGQGVVSFNHISQIRDRDRGQNRPFWETEVELAEIRGISRVLMGVDEAALGISANLLNYTLGTGFQYEVKARDDEDPVANSTAQLADAVLDEFRDRVGWRRLERELMTRAMRDGEDLVWIRDIGGGYSKVKIWEPDSLTEPSDPHLASEFIGAPLLDWSFGVATDLHDTSEVHAYFFDRTGDQRDFEILPAVEIIHISRNVDTGIKRGLSDFYPVWRELDRAAKVRRNTGDGAALQASIAYIRQHQPGVTKASVQSMNIGKREATLSRTTADGNTIDHDFQHMPAGRILDVPNGQEYKPGPMGDGNEGFMMVSDALVRYAALRWAMPSYMSTGSSEQRTFAGLLVAESPFVKAIEAEQQWWCEEFKRVMWRVLEIAASTRRFRRLVDSVFDLRRLLQINIEPPSIASRNRLEETRINQILSSRKLLSDRTWAARENLDLDQERAQRAQDQDEDTPLGPTGFSNDPSEQRQPVSQIGTQELSSAPN